MSEITHFVALPFDVIDDGLVAGEPFKCASPAAAIERAKGFWKIFGHAGAVAFTRTGYPVSSTTVLASRLLHPIYRPSHPLERVGRCELAHMRLPCLDLWIGHSKR